MVVEWAMRPREEAALFNPALIAALLAASAYGYRERSDAAMPWTLAFLVPPLVLHRATREELPRDTRTHLTTWIADHPMLRSSFPARAAGFSPLVREALRVGVRNGALRLGDGSLESTLSTYELQETTVEVTDCIRRSRFLGRWFAISGPPATVYALLGVAP